MFSQFVDQWTKGLTDKEEKAKGLRFILSSILDLQVLLLCKLTILYYHFRIMINVFYSGGNKFVVFFFPLLYRQPNTGFLKVRVILATLLEKG